MCQAAGWSDPSSQLIPAIIAEPSRRDPSASATTTALQAGEARCRPWAHASSATIVRMYAAVGSRLTTYPTATGYLMLKIHSSTTPGTDISPAAASWYGPRRDRRPRVRQARRPALRPVLEVPPLVVVHPVQMVPRPVSFQPPGAFDRPYVQSGPGYVARLVRRQRPVPGERGRAGTAHRVGEQPRLGPSVAVPVGQPDQLTVTPQGLRSRRLEGSPRGWGQAVQVLGRESRRERPLAGDLPRAVWRDHEAQRHQCDREQPGDEPIEVVATARRPAWARRRDKKHLNKLALRPRPGPECPYSSWPTVIFAP